MQDFPLLDDITVSTSKSPKRSRLFTISGRMAILGVDKIYIQAKRYSDNHSVTAGDLRNFIGALDMCRAVKGVFVTTSNFTTDAKNTIKKSSKNIILIDGDRLTQLMIKYSVGCKIKESINIKKIDGDFFEEM